MPAQYPSRIVLAAASLITFMSVSVVAAEDAVKDTKQAPMPAQAPAQADKPVKPSKVAALPASASSAPHHVSKYKYLSRYHNFFMRVRCVHIGCEGVHTLGTAY